MTKTNLTLLEGLKNDDEPSFKVIYNMYFSRLFYFVLEFVPLEDLAENIVQDTFFTLWDKRHQLRDNSELGAYLFTVAKNNCLYRLRSQRYQRKLFDNSYCIHEIELNIEVLSSLDSSEYTFTEIERIIQQTLLELPPQCRNVFTLSRFENFKNREIAEQLSISEKVVEKHISKGLKLFRKALKDYLPFVIYLFVG
ncbi:MULTISPECIES: RNA polymerase sigma-70 factor [unclassified Carboxylicivirga]|uniref:RNA polymerase sigma-70 factor n=1 Tax=Carboxylicivirga TaxID=1628153 RepID=UPI003D3257FC